MKVKLIGIFVCILLITTALNAVGNLNQVKNDYDEYKILIPDSDYKLGEFIVKLTKDSSLVSSSIVKLIEKHQIISIEKVFRKSENSILGNIYLFSVLDYSNIKSILSDFALCSDVVYAEPNYYVGGLCEIPNDPFFDFQWPLNNSGQYEGTPGCDIDAVEAWDIEKGSSNIVIASIDSGIDYYHEDISGNIWNNDDEIPNNGIDDDSNGYIDDIVGWDFVDNDSTPLDNQSAPQYGHGTRCAGVHSAVTNNSIGVAGVAWYCKTMVVRCYYNYYDTTKYANGIVYAADNGADVINIEMSIKSDSQLIKDAVDFAYGMGCFMCASAGNYNSSTKYYPAAYENVTGVGATNQRDERCDEDDWGAGRGSNWGEWVDVAAPGNSLWVLHPDDKYDFNGQGGTSLAAPHVAGLAALLLSQEPSITPDEVKSRICKYVDPYISDVYCGTGRINAYKALVTPPDAPVINGSTSGKPLVEYEYRVISTDPDDHELFYNITWGDNFSTGWFGPYSSGEEVTASHMWAEDGTYEIKAQSKDHLDIISDWSEPLSVSIPRNKSFNFNLFSWFLDRSPLLERLLNIIFLKINTI
jgi:subtilisin family serine protease